jgi:hypothetical protein
LRTSSGDIQASSAFFLLSELSTKAISIPGQEPEYSTYHAAYKSPPDCSLRTLPVLERKIGAQISIQATR